MAESKRQAPQIIVARLNKVPQSPYKVRVVANLVKDMALEDALTSLAVSQKKAARFIEKLLNSAVANAEHNFDIDRKKLAIKGIQVGDGSRLRRLKPRARGRSDVVRKRSSNLRAELEAVEEGEA